MCQACFLVCAFLCWPFIVDPFSHQCTGITKPGYSYLYFSPTTYNRYTFSSVCVPIPAWIIELFFMYNRTFIRHFVRKITRGLYQIAKKLLVNLTKLCKQLLDVSIHPFIMAKDDCHFLWAGGKWWLNYANLVITYFSFLFIVIEDATIVQMLLFKIIPLFYKCFYPCRTLI